MKCYGNVDRQANIKQKIVEINKSTTVKQWRPAVFSLNTDKGLINEWAAGMECKLPEQVWSEGPSGTYKG